MTQPIPRQWNPVATAVRLQQARADIVWHMERLQDLNYEASESDPAYTDSDLADKRRDAIDQMEDALVELDNIIARLGDW